MTYAAYKDADGHAYVNPLNFNQHKVGDCINGAECIAVGTFAEAQAAAAAINEDLQVLDFADLLK